MFAHPIHIRLGTTDLLVLEELSRHAEYEAVRAFLLDDVAVVLDLGANIGLSASLWASWYPSARIVAVEPDRGNAELCRKNLAAARARYSLVNAFVGAENGLAGIDRSLGEWAYKMTEPRNTEDAVRVLSMATLLDRYVGQDTIIDYAKIDIEGAEAAILKQLDQWLPRCRTVLIELHHEFYDPNDLESDIRAARLDTFYQVPWKKTKGSTTLAIIARTAT